MMETLSHPEQRPRTRGERPRPKRPKAPTAIPRETLSPAGFRIPGAESAPSRGNNPDAAITVSKRGHQTGPGKRGKMTTRVHAHSGPHIQVQQLLHQAAAQGAKNARVEIQRDRILYEDDRPFDTTIDMTQFDPDGIYTTQSELSRHPAPEGLHVHVFGTVNVRRSEDEQGGGAGHVHMKAADEGDALPARNTRSGRFTVHLKETRGYGGLKVLDHTGATAQKVLDYTGATAQNHGRFAMRMSRTRSGNPEEPVEGSGTEILALPTPGNPADPTSRDMGEIVRTGMEMFADLLRDRDQGPDGAKAWPDNEAREKLQDAGITGLPETPPTCQKFPVYAQGNQRALLPERPVLGNLPHTSGPGIARQLAKHPDPNRRYQLVDEVQDNEQEIPSLTLTGAEATLQDGKRIKLPVPEIDPEHGWPMTHQKRLEENLLETAESITVTLEYKAPDADPEAFTTETEIYADSDQENHVILSTPELDMDPEAFIRITGLNFYRTGLLYEPRDWFQRYHAGRLTGEDPQALNQDTLTKIAGNLDQVNMRPGETETTATSPSGNITITLHRAK